MDAHPGWEVIEESEDEEEEEQDDDEGSNQKSKKTIVEKPVEEKEAPIKKTKMEDDEYKTASEEHTYYRLDFCIQINIAYNQKLSFVNTYFCFSIAHTIHESVTEQASILVNGNLKEYQIKVCNF